MNIITGHVIVLATARGHVLEQGKSQSCISWIDNRGQTARNRYVKRPGIEDSGKTVEG